MSEGGRGNRPGSAPTDGKAAPEGPNYVPSGGVNADRAWAQNRIGNFLRAQRKARETAGASQAKIPAPGGSLSNDVRERVEPHLGANLADVKVSTSAESAHAAEKMGARAFTVGNSIHFGSGEYAPGTKEGDRLIAHELTHTVQGARSGVQRKEAEGAEAGGEHAAEVSQPGEPAEQEADAAGDHVADQLHGAPKPAGEGAKPGKQPAPAIGAKLDANKVHLAGKAPLRGQKKDELGAGPEAGAVHVGNAVQAGVQQSPQHHVFPQQHRAWFLERGVNVDDYCITMPKDHHEAVHAKPPSGAKGKEADEAREWEWNAAVMKVLKQAESKRKQKLSAKDMLVLVQPLMSAYGFSGAFEKYKGAAK